MSKARISVCLLAVTLALLLPVAAFATPVDQSAGFEKFMMVGPSHDLDIAKTTSNVGVFGSALAGTTYFGGTFWAADSSRWEAIQDSMWTFDTGVGSNFNHSDPLVNPFKNGALHAYMEGWYGIDNSYSELPYFRRMGVSDFAGAPDTCVGTPAGLGGNYSFWAGVLQSEADALCYAAGQGYGTSWNLCIGHSFSYPGGGQNITLQYDYRNETENGWDYTYVVVDTTGLGDDAEAKAYTGVVGGHANLTLTPGVTLPGVASTIIVKFCVVSDGGASDEDGGNPTNCGAFAVDNIAMTGAVVHSATFETGNDGWTLQSPTAGPGGEWSNISDITSLPSVLTPCGCDLQDSVLVFEDLSVGGHGLYQDNIAVSPWIDLLAAGVAGSPGKFIEFDGYFEMPLLNYVFVQTDAQWYPQVCPNTGKLIVSPITSDGFVRYFGGVPTCRRGAEGASVILEFSSVIDVGAEQVRVALGVLSYCRYYANCTGVSNGTPWFDDVRMGVYGDPNAPFISQRTIDVPQDAFPQNGTLRLDAPGRVDCNNVLPVYPPGPNTSLGDTLVVVGGGGGSEVWVQFAIDPGPGTDAAALSSWLSSGYLQAAGTSRGQTWYTARCDSAERGGAKTSGQWMTAYHESNPGGRPNPSDTARDPNDLDPQGQATRLVNDIFPDNLFTAGTRINMFFKTRYVGNTVWYNAPDTTGGVYQEMEVLPSSMAADSSFNCVLYVDHFDGRGAQVFVEGALASVIPGGSANFENTAWDRWDVRAPSSDQGSFGRPLNTQYGATVVQTLGYKSIIWNAGNLGAFDVTKEDAEILNPWLTLTEPGLGFNNLYLNGDDIAQSIAGEVAGAGPAPLHLMNDLMGVSFNCATVRDATCPSGSGIQDTVSCMNINPVTGATVAGSLSGGRSVQHLGQGNGCPQLRSFDVLGVFNGGIGTPLGDEEYNGPAKGTVQFASVVNDVSGGPDFRTVFDGLSLHYRRDPSNCQFTTGNTPEPAVAERLREVLGYFGYTGTLSACSDPTAGLDVPVTPRQPAFKTALANFAPNPLMSGAKGTIQFTVAQRGQAKLDVFDLNGRLVRTLFSGVAEQGVNVARWDGTDSASRPVASGVYFYRLNTNGEDYAKKMVVVRTGN